MTEKTVKVTGSGALGILLGAATKRGEGGIKSVGEGGSTVLDAALQHLSGLLGDIDSRESAFPDSVVLVILEASGCTSTDPLAVRTLGFIAQQTVERIALKAEALQRSLSPNRALEDFGVNLSAVEDETMDISHLEEMFESECDKVEFKPMDDGERCAEASQKLLTIAATVDAIICEGPESSWKSADGGVA
eukprot:GHVH01017493.1.p1 GENE.GHVH01017493.1~~GHVH01017493.1.p1  ORF type:complete len:191 (+),score=39.12 GHVH01017493.1:143-715(+)